jgi:hypothetical protein
VKKCKTFQKVPLTGAGAANGARQTEFCEADWNKRQGLCLRTSTSRAMRPPFQDESFCRTNLFDREFAVFLAPEWIGLMALFRVKPNLIDERLAKEIASRASLVPEEVARF